MTLTTEGYVKLWDRESFSQISKLKLIHSTETVCLTANSDANLFAVGSQSHISITDPRSSSIVHVAESCDEGWGVRALDFKSHIITTGGGFGRLGFYDLRAQKYLDGFDNGQSNRRYQEIGPGWLVRSIFKKKRDGKASPSSFLTHEHTLSIIEPRHGLRWRHHGYFDPERCLRARVRLDGHAALYGGRATAAGSLWCLCRSLVLKKKWKKKALRENKKL